MYKNPHAHERDVLASVVDLLLADSVVGQQVRERVLEHSVREMVQTVGELDPRLIVKLAVKHLDSHPFVRSAYEQLLKEYKGNLTQLAANLGVSRTTLYNHMVEYGISHELLRRSRL